MPILVLGGAHNVLAIGNITVVNKHEACKPSPPRRAKVDEGGPK